VSASEVAAAAQNWADEIRKWLGAERMRALVLQPGTEAKQQVPRYTRPFQKQYSLLCAAVQQL
jgi:hypothetical protein